MNPFVKGLRVLRRALGPAVMALAAWAPSTAMAQTISDAEFFSGLPATVVDFETNGQGQPIRPTPLLPGEILALPADAYAPLGFTFDRNIHWVNDGNPSFRAAQLLANTGPTAIPAFETPTFTINFTVPVRAVGLWIANNFQVDTLGPSFVARGSGGQVLASTSFGALSSGSAFVDRRVGTADFGFMGLVSGELITSLTISKQAAILDLLTFSEIPTPGAITLFLLGGLAFLRRTR